MPFAGAQSATIAAHSELLVLRRRKLKLLPWLLLRKQLQLLLLQRRKLKLLPWLRWKLLWPRLWRLG